MKLLNKLQIKQEIEGKEIEVICDSDTPLGVLHDALMKVKGWAIERMIQNQKEEESAMESCKGEEDGSNS